MTAVMNAEQAFNYAMNTYPTLYASDSLEDAKFKYYDHIFNVGGNGFKTLNAFMERYQLTENNKPLVDGFPAKYIEPCQLFYAYSKCVEKFKGTSYAYTSVDMNSKIEGIFSEEDKNNNPKIAALFPIEKTSKDAPHPNFTKEYSFVWKYDITQLDISWTEAALWYYEKAKEFFNSDNNHLYSHAWPKDIDKQKELVQEYNERFANLKEEAKTIEEFKSLVLTQYETEYNENTEDFIKQVWSKELNRIHFFLDETLDKLNQHLSLRKEKFSSNRKVR